MLVFEERGKPEYPEKNLSEQSREPTNSAHLRRRVRESNPGHIGGRRVLYHCANPAHLRSQHKDTLFTEDENETGRPGQPAACLNTSQKASGRGNYSVCPVCSCTMEDEGGCLRCEQDREYECSLIADGGSTSDNPVTLTLD